jgi:hypothetical protein
LLRTGATPGFAKVLMARFSAACPCLMLRVSVPRSTLATVAVTVPKRTVRTPVFAPTMCMVAECAGLAALFGLFNGFFAALAIA